MYDKKPPKWGKYRVDGNSVRYFKMRADADNERVWICKKCGLKRSSKKTHKHGSEIA